MKDVSITAVSDLHGHYPSLEGGDLLIVAGDLTATHTIDEFQQFLTWFRQQKYTKKILVGGNHDTFLDEGIPLSLCDQIEECCEYLLDKSTEFNGLKIYGSPWTKTFPGINPYCKAFTVDTDEELAEKWALIPNDVDILITHSPPNGILDGVMRDSGTSEYCGSISLRNEVIQRIKSQLHIFGHIHEWGGHQIDLIATKFINCSYVNQYYKPVNKPVRVVL